MKNTATKFIYVIVSLVLIFGCNNTATQKTDKLGAPIETAKVVLNQKAKTDTSINYCFYLPISYNGTTSLPVIYLLDPHANGKLPTQKYAEIANKYNYILVASNNIKNGIAAQQAAINFKNLISEVKNRFQIDAKRMFVSGFSGGAKMAIVFAQQFPEIIGVAACGGTLPIPPSHKPDYYYAGIVGSQDFNYLESNQTFSLFDQQGFDYTSVIFNGGHEWPPVKSFEMALIGFDIYAMKLKRTEKDDKWLEMVWNRMNDSLTHFNETKDFINENIYTRQASRWFYGLKNTKELNQRGYKIENSSDFVNQVKKRQKLIQTEVKLRAEFIRAIELRELYWWNTEIGNINKSINQTDKDVAAVSQRLLNYISMAGFMLSKTDLEDSKLDNALKKLKIYEMVDPKNPDVFLMYARYYMQLDDFTAMNENFKKAIALGFSDFETYKAESFWEPLFSNKQLEL